MLPGQRHNGIAAPYLIEGVDMEALLADKGFDNNRLHALLRDTETQALIPPKADRKGNFPRDFAMYRWRHLVENFFCDLQQFTGIATRYGKTDENLMHVAQKCAAVLRLRHASKQGPKARWLRLTAATCFSGLHLPPRVIQHAIK